MMQRMAELVYEERRFSYNPGLVLMRFVNALIGIIELFLIIRVVFELMRANAASPFVAWLYDFTGRLTAPFSGAFAPITLAGITFDPSTVIAMIAYAVIGWIVIWFIDLVFA